MANGWPLGAVQSCSGAARTLAIEDVMGARLLGGIATIIGVREVKLDPGSDQTLTFDDTEGEQ